MERFVTTLTRSISGTTTLTTNRMTIYNLDLVPGKRHAIDQLLDSLLALNGVAVPYDC